MRCSLTENGSKQLLEWQATPLGNELMIREQHCAEGMVADLFGCYMLQIGWGLAFCQPIAHNRIRRRIILAPPHTNSSGLCEYLNELEMWGHPTPHSEMWGHPTPHPEMWGHPPPPK